MQIEVVRHHGRTQNADRNEKTGGVQPWYEPADHIAPYRLCKPYLERHAGGDGQDHHADKGFELSNPVTLQRDHHDHVSPGDERTPAERNIEQQVQRDGASQQRPQVARDDGNLAQPPQRQHRRPPVVRTTGLRQIDAATNPEANRQRLQQHRNQVRRKQHPQQLIAEAGATFQVSCPIARVHVADAHQRRRAEKPQRAPAAWRAHVDSAFEVAHRDRATQQGAATSPDAWSTRRVRCIASLISDPATRRRHRWPDRP